ncbi:MAG: hypothetical protein Tsb0014_15040 [Pleurocapsa sp.]
MDAIKPVRGYTLLVCQLENDGLRGDKRNRGIGERPRVADRRKGMRERGTRHYNIKINKFKLRKCYKK